MQVPHDIVLSLPVVHDEEFSALRSKGGIHIFNAEPHQPVTVLDYDYGNVRVPEDPEHRPAMAV
jgi:hypothetical protein